MRPCARIRAVFAAIALSSVGLVIGADAPPPQAASGPVTGPAQQSRWERDLAGSYEVVRLLYRSEPIGNNVSEVFQWKAKALKDNPRRIQDLQVIVKEHPDSPFADDAALLLARAQFLYKGDAAGAIDGLYEVSKKYPDGLWLAGDPMVLEALAPLAGRLKPYVDGDGNPRIKVLEDSKRAERNVGESRSQLSKVQEYLDYQDARPNKTSDEAKYWIAWIIMQAKLEDRYPEAQRLLGEVGQKYKDTSRTKEDVAAAVKMGNSLVGKLPRVERSASVMLVELLEKTGRKAEALAEVQRHLLVYEGSPSADWAKQKAEQLGQK